MLIAHGAYQLERARAARRRTLRSTAHRPSMHTCNAWRSQSGRARNAGHETMTRMKTVANFYVSKREGS